MAMPLLNYIRYYMIIYYLHLDIGAWCERNKFDLADSKDISTKYLSFKDALLNHNKMANICQFNLTKDAINLLLIRRLLRVK